MRRTLRTRGFTLVEVAIVLVLTGILTGGVLLLFGSTSRTYQFTTTDTELLAHSRRTVDKIAELALLSRRSNVVPAPPDAESPSSASQIDFRAATALAGGAPVWGSTQRIEFQYSPSDPDDGVDNDRNGLVDDGRVVWTRELGQPGQNSTVLSRWVPEFQAQETPDGTDENGNGLVDERGLSFDFDGNCLTIRLSLERVVNQGWRSRQSVQRTIAFRNIGG